MQLATLKDNTFLNDWLSQIHSKVQYIPDNVLVDALQYIENKGIPTIKDEAYRNVPIESILKRYFRTLNIQQPAESPVSSAFQFPNQIFISESQTQFDIKEKGISIYTKDFSKKYLNLIGRTGLHQKDFFAALNTAYCGHFTIIHLTQTLNHPLYIHYNFSNTNSNFIQHRILVLADENVSATIFENASGSVSHPVFINHLSEVYLNTQSKIHWISFQNEKNNQLYFIQNASFSLKKQAELTHHQISLNGALWRNNLNIHLDEPEANAKLNGLSIGKQQNIISQNTSVFHHSGYAQSNQLYKNIADDKSIVLFNGFIQVDKNAQKTNAYQSSKNLLLNDNATIFAKPQLEIYADDVKCSHGSSTGALNEDALFYLRARGIDKTSAQKLLLLAFFNDIIESIENTDIREYISQQITI